MPRRAASTVAVLAVALTLVLALGPALALGSTPVAVTIAANAPIAVRSGKTLTLRGSASVGASSGETLTVAFQRLKATTWSTVATSVVVLDSRRAFSATYKPGLRGHWRALVSIEATLGHVSATSRPAAFKVVGPKVIALTFDDGPWPSSTDKIVNSLAKLDVQATFFMLGRQVQGAGARAKSVATHGNLVGVHSWNHALMTRRSSAANRADLKRSKNAIAAATGVVPTWFRPPYGATNRSLKSTASKLGLRQVIWTVDTLDWKYRNASSITSRALRGARSGGVVLMHDGGGPRAATVAAVPAIVKKLRARGFDFVTLDEMTVLGYSVR